MENKRVVLVLGVQRSGTNALHRSLALDPWVAGFNEDGDNEFYHKYRLREPSSFLPVIGKFPGIVLLKPIMDIIKRDLSELYAKFPGCEVKTAWTYRDPVNVFYSRVKRWPQADWTEPESFSAKWNEINRKGLEQANQTPQDFAIVSYDDMTVDYATFRGVSRFLGIQGVWLFRADSRSGYRHLATEVQEQIMEQTREVREALDAARTFQPKAKKELPSEAREVAEKIDAMRQEMAEQRGKAAELEQEIRDLEYRLFNLSRRDNERD
ncbi:MAG: hypothetical protein D6E12_13365 [Desulfovibrio sp.]|nr:MAG: hypothetical protein D6E12_13365 [Desulfovibrio sp.]